MENLYLGYDQCLPAEGKYFQTRPLIMASKRLLLTAPHPPKVCGPRLTAKWISGEPCSVCCRVKRSEIRGESVVE